MSGDAIFRSKKIFINQEQVNSNDGKNFKDVHISTFKFKMQQG